MTSILDKHGAGMLAPLSHTELGRSMDLPLARIKGRRHQEEAVRFARAVLDDLLERGVIGWCLDGETTVYGKGTWPDQ